MLSNYSYFDATEPHVVGESYFIYKSTFIKTKNAESLTEVTVR
jgi:hypothetical protein